MYMFAIPIAGFLIYLSYEGYIMPWVWVVMSIVGALWFAFSLSKGGINR